MTQNTSPYPAESAPVELPAGHPPQGRALGDPDTEPLGVFLSTAAASSLEKCLVDVTTTSAGVLLGRVAVTAAAPKAGTAGRPFILITGVIAAKAAIADQAELFTPEDWRLIREQQDKSYPDCLTVGWFVNRPGTGATAGEDDCRQKSRFFPHSWQVLLAVDSERNISHFYRWDATGPTPVDSFTVWNEAKEPVSRLIGDGVGDRPPTYPAVADDALVNSATPAAGRRLWPLAIGGLLLLLLVFMLLWRGSPFSLRHLASLTTEKQEELTRLQNDLTMLSQTTVSYSSPAAGTAAADRPAAAAATANPQPAPTAETGQATQSYIIKHGDTLWDISLRMLGSPWEYRRLAAANGITNPSRIYPGTPLSLP